MKKAVGVVPLYDEEKQSYWMLPGYMKMLEAAGAIPMMLPLTDRPDELDYFLGICGGLLFTGGQDVSPEVYREEKHPVCGKCCELRDKMEAYLLKQAVEQDRSVLGICRGIQFMNACFGGSLYQDIPTEYESMLEHHMTPPYDRIAHRVDIKKNTLLFDILGLEQMGVNSYHHQAIKDLSPVFEEMAVAGDGLIEGIYMPSRKFVAGVQWHPELSYETDANSRKLIGAFVDSIESVFS